MNTSSNAIWKAEQDPATFESGRYRFREEMLPLFYQYLGITPHSRVLDGGCGSGALTRFLAKGLDSGHITGFEINAGFVQYGNQRLQELGLSQKAMLEEGDGFCLKYSDNQFDAVTNYRYLGVLSDPEAGLKELIRVCKPGGTISSVIAANNLPSAHWQGGYPFEGADKLQGLATRENVIFSYYARQPDDYRQSGKWSDLSYPALFLICGLKEIHLYPFSFLICYNDMELPPEERKKLALKDTQDEISWLQYRYQGKEEIYSRNGFSRSDFQRLITLLNRKLEYLQTNFEADRSYEWFGGYNFILTGIK